MQPLSGLHRASDGYLGTVSRGQSGQGSAATAATIVKPEPQALGAGPFVGPLLPMGVILCLLAVHSTWLHQQWQQ